MYAMLSYEWPSVERRRVESHSPGGASASRNWQPAPQKPSSHAQPSGTQRPARVPVAPSPLKSEPQEMVRQLEVIGCARASV